MIGTVQRGLRGLGFVFLAGAAAAHAACSTGDPALPPSLDAGAIADAHAAPAASDASTDGDVDAASAADAAPDADAGDAAHATDSGDGAALVNGCAVFLDRTGDADARTIPWDFGVTTAQERCMKIRAGQTVTWNGDLSVGMHPLEAAGGDTPTPIPGAAATNGGQVTFADTGTFGFACGNHPSMRGAIEVVP